MKKFATRLFDILLALLVAVALAIAAPNLFGIKTLAVLSGSMEPTIHTGSIVFVAPGKAQAVRAGDVISYVLNQRGTVSTHRVVEVDAENSRFVTKGDHNPMSDPAPVPFNNLLGTVKLTIPLVGYALGFVLTAQGKIITGTVIVALILLIALLSSEDEPQRAGSRSAGACTAPRRHVYSRSARYVPQYPRRG